MRARERISAVTTGPGTKCEGDTIVYLYGEPFDLANVGWALREFALNEERLKASGLRPHWKLPPVQFLSAFLTEAMYADDAASFDDVCAKYKLWGFRR